MHKNLIQSIPLLKIQVIHRPARKNKVNLDSAQKKHVNFDPQTKTKSISIHRLKPSHFRPPHKTQVNFDPCTKIKSISIPHTKIKLISNKIQVNFGAQTKSSLFRSPTQNNLMSTPTLNVSKVRLPL